MKAINRIANLLNDELYAESKNWRDSNLEERVYWLLSSYDSKVEECEKLWKMLAEIQDGD